MSTYEEVPSTGSHRGGRLDVAITTSVRAQEAVDPLRARRKKEKDSVEPTKKGDEQTPAAE